MKKEIKRNNTCNGERKKALIIASMASMLENFNQSNIEILVQQGYEVTLAANFKSEDTNSFERRKQFWNSMREKGHKVYHIDFTRKLFNIKGHIRSYKQVFCLAKEHFDLVHCHAPICSVITRIIFRKYRKLSNDQDTKVIYTAHGFHFYKGASLLNWVLYFPVEWICAHWTDVLITINNEDYVLAKRVMKAKKVVYIPGIGIDLNKFGGQGLNRGHIREELKIPNKAKLLFSVGELNENKNHLTVIKALAELPEVKSGSIFYAIAGQGDLVNKLQEEICNLHMEMQVKILGFRDDIADLYDAADVFIFPSFREGLSVSLMEAMASGLPVICSEIRGNVDLIDEKGGIYFNPGDIDSVKKAIEKIIHMEDDIVKVFGQHNLEKIKSFNFQAIENVIKVAYQSIHKEERATILSTSLSSTRGGGK